MTNLYEELKRRLAPGFYPDNLLAAARLAHEASWQTSAPLGLYVLSEVLSSLAEEWPEQGIASSVAEEMTLIMKPPIDAYIEAASARELTTEEEAAYLNGILRALLQWESGR